MSTIGRTMSLKGELHSGEDITVEGRIDGSVFVESGSVLVGASADVTGDILARDITVLGRAAGRLVASEVVDIRSDATVTGEVVSQRFILDAGARFDGHVAPQHLEAALRVHRFQQKKKAANEAPSPLAARDE